MWLLQRGQFIVICVICTCNILLLATVLGAGKNFIYDKAQHEVDVASAGYEENTLSQCTLDAVAIMHCGADNWVTVWRRKETGMSVVLSAVNNTVATYEEAVFRRDLFNASVPYPCVCRQNIQMPFPSISCNAEDIGTCVLDYHTVRVMQHTRGLLIYGGNLLAVPAAINIVLCSVFFIFLLLICVNQKKYLLQSTEVNKEPIFVLGDEK